MGLFTNNIAPIVSADINWNKIGYAAWAKAINDNHSSVFNNRFWWSIGSDVNGYQPEPVFHNSNELKDYIFLSFLLNIIMGIFSSDIVTQEVKGTKKLQFMISIEEYINKYKNDFIRDHANGRDKILFFVLDRLIKDMASRFNLSPYDGEDNLETNTYCAGRFRYIRDDLYIVVRLKDSRNKKIRRDFTLKHVLENPECWDVWNDARNRMNEEIESTCERNGEMILIYDKDMNLVKEKMNEYGFV